MVCPDLSLILACYNEEAIIEDRTRKIFEVLDALHLTSEVIFVDDASCDGTGRIIDHILIENSNRDLRKIVHAETSDAAARCPTECVPRAGALSALLTWTSR